MAGVEKHRPRRKQMPAKPPEPRAALGTEDNKGHQNTLSPSQSAGKPGRGRGSAKPSVLKSAPHTGRNTRSLDRSGSDSSPLEKSSARVSSSQSKPIAGVAPSINLKDLEELDLSSLDSGPGQNGTAGSLRSFSTPSVQPNQDMAAVAGKESKSSRSVLPPPSAAPAGQFSGKIPVASPIVVGDKKTATGKASPARIASNSNLNESGECFVASLYLQKCCGHFTSLCCTPYIAYTNYRSPLLCSD